MVILCCMGNIVKLHGTHVSILSYNDQRFYLRVWKEFQDSHKIEVYHDILFSNRGKSKRMIHVLEDLLTSCVLDWQCSWEDHLSLVVSAYNNSYQTTIGLAPIILWKTLQITLISVGQQRSSDTWTGIILGCSKTSSVD